VKIMQSTLSSIEKSSWQNGQVSKCLDLLLVVFVINTMCRRIPILRGRDNAPACGQCYLYLAVGLGGPRSMAQGFRGAFVSSSSLTKTYISSPEHEHLHHNNNDFNELRCQ
jgi:hypothetical protein